MPAAWVEGRGMEVGAGILRESFSGLQQTGYSGIAEKESTDKVCVSGNIMLLCPLKRKVKPCYWFERKRK